MADSKNNRWLPPYQQVLLAWMDAIDSFRGQRCWYPIGSLTATAPDGCEISKQVDTSIDSVSLLDVVDKFIGRGVYNPSGELNLHKGNETYELWDTFKQRFPYQIAVKDDNGRIVDKDHRVTFVRRKGPMFTNYISGENTEALQPGVSLKEAVKGLEPIGIREPDIPMENWPRRCLTNRVLEEMSTRTPHAVSNTCSVSTRSRTSWAAIAGLGHESFTDAGVDESTDDSYKAASSSSAHLHDHGADIGIGGRRGGRPLEDVAAKFTELWKKATGEQQQQLLGELLTEEQIMEIFVQSVQDGKVALDDVVEQIRSAREAGNVGQLEATMMANDLKTDANGFVSRLVAVLSDVSIGVKQRAKVIEDLLGFSELTERAFQNIWKEVSDVHYKTWKGVPVESFVAGAEQGGGLNLQATGNDVTFADDEAEHRAKRSKIVVDAVLKAAVTSAKLHRRVNALGSTEEERKTEEAIQADKAGLLLSHAMGLRFSSAQRSTLLWPDLLIRGLQLRLGHGTSALQETMRAEGLTAGVKTNCLMEKLAGETAAEAEWEKFREFLRKKIDGEKNPGTKRFWFWLYDNFNPIRFSQLIQSGQSLARIIDSIQVIGIELESYVSDDPSLPPITPPFDVVLSYANTYMEECHKVYLSKGIGKGSGVALDGVDWPNESKWAVACTIKRRLNDFAMVPPLGKKSSSYHHWVDEDGILSYLLGMDKVPAEERADVIIGLGHDSEPAALMMRAVNEKAGATEAREKAEGKATASARLQEAESMEVDASGGTAAAPSPSSTSNSFSLVAGVNGDVSDAGAPVKYTGEHNLRWLEGTNVDINTGVWSGHAPWHSQKSLASNLGLVAALFIGMVAPTLHDDVEYRAEHFRLQSENTSLEKQARGRKRKRGDSVREQTAAGGASAVTDAVHDHDESVVESELGDEETGDGPQPEDIFGKNTLFESAEAGAEFLEEALTEVLKEWSCKKCRGGCQNGRCKCFAHKQGCTETCGCIDCTNTYGQGGKDDQPLPKDKWKEGSLLHPGEEALRGAAKLGGEADQARTSTRMRYSRLQALTWAQWRAWKESINDVLQLVKGRYSDVRIIQGLTAQSSIREVEAALRMLPNGSPTQGRTEGPAAGAKEAGRQGTCDGGSGHTEEDAEECDNSAVWVEEFLFAWRYYDVYLRAINQPFDACFHEGKGYVLEKSMGTLIAMEYYFKGANAKVGKDAVRKLGCSRYCADQRPDVSKTLMANSDTTMLELFIEWQNSRQARELKEENEPSFQEMLNAYHRSLLKIKMELNSAVEKGPNGTVRLNEHKRNWLAVQSPKWNKTVDALKAGILRRFTSCVDGLGGFCGGRTREEMSPYFSVDIIAKGYEIWSARMVGGHASVSESIARQKKAGARVVKPAAGAVEEANRKKLDEMKKELAVVLQALNTLDVSGEGFAAQLADLSANVAVLREQMDALHERGGDNIAVEAAPDAVASERERIEAVVGYQDTIRT